MNLCCVNGPPPTWFLATWFLATWFLATWFLNRYPHRGRRW
jgi:hypothetical protein